MASPVTPICLERYIFFCLDGIIYMHFKSLIHCVENVFSVQDFWATCPWPETQSLPWKFVRYWIYSTFYHSGFLSNLRLPWKTELTWNFWLYWNTFYHSRFLSNLRLPWKTRCALNSLYWINTFYHKDFWATYACPEKQCCLKFFTLLRCFYHSWYLSNLRLPCKQSFALKIFTVLKYFLSFRIFEQLALALKNRVALKFFTVLKMFFIIQDFWATCACPENSVCREIFQDGGAAAPAPPRTPISLIQTPGSVFK